LHAEDAITIENSEIKKDFMFVKDFFFTFWMSLNLSIRIFIF